MVSKNLAAADACDRKKAVTRALFFTGRTWPSLFERKGGGEGEAAASHRPTAQRLPSKNTARMGDEGKAVGFLADGFAV